MQFNISPYRVLSVPYINYEYDLCPLPPCSAGYTSQGTLQCMGHSQSGVNASLIGDTSWDPDHLTTLNTKWYIREPCFQITNITG